jgi:pyruvate/2-oxoacid:ferredoxin oxidoreductase beta subunit/Pyruvate/2-oxoacid:ferredoxin oxidoreductase gamma subunit
MTVQSYIDQSRLPYPFCPGCSHGHVLDRLDEAMIRLDLDPTKVVVVTDIGCVGLSDQWFKTHAFHGLHGRSVVYAEGLKIASPELHVIVLVGDGGAGIGLTHLLNAAKRNVGINIVLFNNMNFGMTGGEHSITTPEGSVTSTTTGGHFEKPIQLCETLKLNNAPFVARRAYYDKDLPDVIERAIAFDGLSFVEVLEFCTAYYVPFNKFDKKSMEAVIESGGLPRTTFVDDARTEYTAGYRAYLEKSDAQSSPDGVILEKTFEHGLSGNLDVVVAGSAGMKVGSAATLFSRAAILSGLQAVQRDDYPVTVKTGHSLSFVKIAEKVIGYMGIKTPDVLFVISEDGLKKAAPYLSRMRESQRVYVLDTLPEVETEAQVIRIDLSGIDGRVPKEGIALTVLSSYLKSGSVFPADALIHAAKLGGKVEIAKKQVEFVERGKPAIFMRA